MASNKRRQAIKKKSYKYLHRDEKKELLKEVEKEVKEANQRLSSLSRHYKIGTWATRKLKNRLDTQTINAWNKQTNRIKIPSNITITQLKAIQKAIDMFNKSKTSTHKQIKEIKKSTKESLRKTLSLEDREIDEEDTEILYSMLSDNDFQNLVDKIPASDIWATIQDAVEHNDSQNNFIKRIENLIDFGNDIDLKNSAIALYDKYVI